MVTFELGFFTVAPVVALVTFLAADLFASAFDDTSVAVCKAVRGEIDCWRRRGCCISAAPDIVSRGIYGNANCKSDDWRDWRARYMVEEFRLNKLATEAKNFSRLPCVRPRGPQMCQP